MLIKRGYEKKKSSRRNMRVSERGESERVVEDSDGRGRRGEMEGGRWEVEKSHEGQTHVPNETRRQ
jgi:hypothetical protein